MKPLSSSLRLQLVVFALVSASFTNVYLTQPVLPVLAEEFGAGMVLVSFSVSAVLFGIAIANLPFGSLSDRYPIRPLISVGGAMVATGGLIVAVTHSLPLLIAARFLQGLFIPALTTCLAAYLARSLPVERLNVVMGSYVSATVVGGLGGRLLGGWIHPPLHWRFAFVSAAVFIIVATLVALRWLSAQAARSPTERAQAGYLQILGRRDLAPVFACAAGGFAVFSTVFNYLPFRLSEPVFGLSTGLITLIYCVYVVGIGMGPLAGRGANRYGSGPVILVGVAILLGSLLLLLVPHLAAVLAGLIGLCAGFFAIHAAAVGTLNRSLTSGHGRANALYVLFYYGGGWLGITAAGVAYRYGGWQGAVCLAGVFLLAPAIAGVVELRTTRERTRS